MNLDTVDSLLPSNTWCVIRFLANNNETILLCTYYFQLLFHCTHLHDIGTFKLTTSMSLFSVERYDPRSNTWTKVSPMGTHRKHLGVAVYNNMIYAVGGRDDSSELSSAEKYNPQTNTWQPVVAMTSRRSGVCIMCHMIHCYPCVYVTECKLTPLP